MALKFNGQLLLPSHPKFPKTDPLPIKVSASHPPFSDDRLLQLHSPNSIKKPFLLSKVLSLAIAISLSSSESPLPSVASPVLNGSQTTQSRSLPSITPFSQAKNLPIGLENGKIRPCPSINPGCISTNPNSSSFALPWVIPESSSQDAIKQLEDAILMTQKNAKILSVEDTPYGKYLQAEVDGGFSRDVLEFLVKGDTTVTYRAMATKVTYVYPFTTAFGDSEGQEQRLKQIVERLGWSAPILDFED